MFDSEQYPDFTYENNGVGTVKVQVSAANQAFPLEGIEIEISKEINGDGLYFLQGKPIVVESLMTYIYQLKKGKKILNQQVISYTQLIS